MDMYLRLDLELQRLFDALDEKVGEGQWTAFLSADHGGANVPSHAASMGMPTDYWKPGNLMDAVDAIARPLGLHATAANPGFCVTATTRCF